ncbi:hypothetical protein ABIB80_004439 [Bradyrhizobium sp. i1.15.2]
MDAYVALAKTLPLPTIKRPVWALIAQLLSQRLCSERCKDHAGHGRGTAR